MEVFLSEMFTAMNLENTATGKCCRKTKEMKSKLFNLASFVFTEHA